MGLPGEKTENMALLSGRERSVMPLWPSLHLQYRKAGRDVIVQGAMKSVKHKWA